MLGNVLTPRRWKPLIPGGPTCRRLGTLSTRPRSWQLIDVPLGATSISCVLLRFLWPPGPRLSAIWQWSNQRDGGHMLRTSLALGFAVAMVGCVTPSPAWTPQEVSPGVYRLYSYKAGRTPDISMMSEGISRAGDFCSHQGKKPALSLYGDGHTVFTNFKCE